MAQVDTRLICFGLMRLGGALGFFAFAAGAVWIAHASLGVSMPPLLTPSDLTGRQIVVGVVAVGVGVLGLLVGQTFGAAIPIGNDKTAGSIDAFWHITTYTVIAWGAISGSWFGWLLGREAAEAFWQARGTVQLVWLGLGVPVGAGVAMAAAAWFTLDVLPDVAPGCVVFLATLCAPFAICGGCGIYTAAALGLTPAWGLPAALLPILVMPMSAASMQKDRLMRTAT